MYFHPWHDVELPTDSPTELLTLIEVPKGSKVKYELDKVTGLIRVDRILYSAVHYPANYGFIPRTLGEDHDPLDILVLCQEPVLPLSLMRARPIGVMKMIDQGEADDKIIAVHLDDPEYRHYKEIEELAPHRMKEIKRFFEDYKRLEEKEVVVEDFLPKKNALNIIKAAIQRYNESDYAASSS